MSDVLANCLRTSAVAGDPKIVLRIGIGVPNGRKIASGKGINDQLSAVTISYNHHYKHRPYAAGT